MTTLPPNYLRLSSKWLIDNPLPEDALAFNNGMWHGSACRGMVVPHPELYPYATARTDLPREAYADDEIRPMTPEEHKALDEFTMKELRREPGAEVKEERGLTFWKELARMTQEGMNELKSRFEAKEAENDKLRAEVERLTIACEKEFASVQELNDQNTRLTAELDAVRKELEKLRGGFDALGVDFHQQADELDAAQARAEAAERDRDAFNQLFEMNPNALWSRLTSAQARCGELERAGKELIAAQDDFDTAIGKRENELENGFKTERVKLELRAARTRLTKARSVFLTPSQQPDNFDSSSTEGRALKADSETPLRSMPNQDRSENQASPAVNPSRPEPVKAGEWLPIESAPKTGDDLHAIEILGWIPDATDIWDGGDFDVVYWEPLRGHWFCRGHEVPSPTHWQPLPAPPIAPEGKATEGEG